MMRRMGRPGLVGTMARTAVIAGTATAVSGRVAAKQQSAAMQGQAAAQQDADTQARLAALEEQPAAPVSAPAGDDLVSQLQKLADLKAAGVLDQAEFDAAKAKLLAS